MTRYFAAKNGGAICTDEYSGYIYHQDLWIELPEKWQSPRWVGEEGGRLSTERLAELLRDNP